MIVLPLLLLQIFALRMTFGNATIRLLCCKNMAGGLINACHVRLIAGENAKVVLFGNGRKQAVNFFRWQCRLGADNEQHAATAHPLSDLVNPGQWQHFVVRELARGFEQRGELVPDQFLHFIFGRISRESLQHLGEVFGAIKVILLVAGVMQIPRLVFEAFKRLKTFRALPQRRDEACRHVGTC